MSSEGFPGDRRVARDTSRQPPEAPEAEVGIIAESSSKIWGGGNGAPGPICQHGSPSPQPPQYSQTVSSKTVSSKTVSYASPHAGPGGRRKWAQPSRIYSADLKALARPTQKHRAPAPQPQKKLYPGRGFKQKRLASDATSPRFQSMWPLLSARVCELVYPGPH